MLKIIYICQWLTPEFNFVILWHSETSIVIKQILNIHTNIRKSTYNKNDKQEE